MTLEDEIQLKKEIEHIFDSGANQSRIYNMVLNFLNKRNKNSNKLILNNILEKLYERELYLKSFKINENNHFENISRLKELLLVEVYIQQQLINNL